MWPPRLVSEKSTVAVRPRRTVYPPKFGDRTSYEGESTLVLKSNSLFEFVRHTRRGKCFHVRSRKRCTCSNEHLPNPSKKPSGKKHQSMCIAISASRRGPTAPHSHTSTSARPGTGAVPTAPHSHTSTSASPGLVPSRVICRHPKFHWFGWPKWGNPGNNSLTESCQRKAGKELCDGDDMACAESDFCKQ